MARSKSDLPRMQNPARSRAPLKRDFNLVSQVIGRTEKPDQPAPMMRQYELIERVRRYNPDTDETALGAGVRAVLDAFAPRWLQAEIPDQQVDQWLVDHGFVTQEEVRALRAERKAKLRGEGTDGERT